MKINIELTIYDYINLLCLCSIFTLSLCGIIQLIIKP